MDDLIKKHSTARSTSRKKIDVRIVKSELTQWLELFNIKQAANHIKETITEIKSRLEDLSNLSAEGIQFDVLRLIVCRDYGLSPKLALEYLMESFKYSKKLRPILYVALIIFETQQSGFPDHFFQSLEADLCEHNMHMMKWLACTSVVFENPLLDLLSTHLKSMVFDSVIQTELVSLASAVLLNLYRTHGALLTFSDVVHRFAPTMTREGVKTRVVTNLAGIASLTCQHSEVDARCLAPEMSKLLEQELQCWPSPIRHAVRFASVNKISASLRFFESFKFRPTKRLEGTKRHGYSAPRWWTILQSLLEDILRKEISFESEEDAAANQDTPLGSFRSAALVAALQISAATTLSKILQNQVSGQPSDLHALSCNSVQHGIVFGSLLTVATQCLSRLMTHSNVNIKLSAVRCATVLYTNILSHIIDRHAEVHSQSVEVDATRRPPEEIVFFTRNIASAVDALLFAAVKQIETGGIGDLEILRVTIDAAVAHCSEKVLGSVQIMLLNKAKEYNQTERGGADDDDDDNDSSKRIHKEIVRGLLLFSHRNYLHSLHAVAGCAGVDVFNSVVQETGGHFGGLVGMEVGGAQEGAQSAFERRSNRRDDQSSMGSFSEDEKEREEAVGEVKGNWWRRYELARDVDMPTLRSFNEMKMSVLKMDEGAVSLTTPTLSINVSPPEEDTNKTIAASPLSDVGSILSQSSTLSSKSPRRSPRVLKSKSSSGLFHTLKRLGSGGGDEEMTSPSKSPRKTVSMFASDALNFLVEENFSGSCSGTGVMDSVTVEGIMYMSSKISRSGQFMVGLNICHPAFKHIENRLSRSELVNVSSLVIHEDHVHKVDPKGSILLNVEAGEIHDVPLLEYSIVSSGTNCSGKSPLQVKTNLECNYNEKDANLCSISFAIILVNTSGGQDVTDFDMTLIPPEYNKFMSFEFNSSKKKVKASFDQISKRISIKATKIKSLSTARVNVTIKATGVDYNRFGALDRRLRLLEDLDSDLFASSTQKMCPPAEVRFSLALTKGGDTSRTNTSPLTGIALRSVENISSGTSPSKFQSKVTFRSFVDSYTASVRDDASPEEDSTSRGGGKSSLRHLDSVGDVITLDTEECPPPSAFLDNGDDDGGGWGSPLYDEDCKGLPAMPDRPWEWEEDARLLEALGREDEFDFSGIQARAIAPLDSFAVIETIRKFHEKNSQPIVPPKKKLESIKLHRQKLLLRQSSRLGVLEAGGSDSEESDLNDEYRIDVPEEEDDEFEH